MLSWWHRDVIAVGKLPLMLCFVSFVVTFTAGGGAGPDEPARGGGTAGS